MGIRLLINWSFFFALFGNFLASFGRACSTHACTKVSVKWFLPENRPLISSILLLGAPLGTIVGYQITTFFIPSDVVLLEGENINGKFFNLMLYEGIILICMSLPAALLYKNDPPTPTSAAAEKPKSNESAKTQIMKLVRNKNYLPIWSHVSVMLGIYALLSAACSEIIQPFGFTASDSSNIITFILLSAIIGVAAGTFIQKKMGEFKKLIVVCCIGFQVSLVLWVLCMYIFPGETLPLAIPSVLVGIFIAPVLTIGVELACEIGYPVGESYSNGMIQIFGNILGIVFSEFVPLLLKEDNRGRSFLTMCLVFVIGALGLVWILFMEEKLNRSDQEKLLSEESEMTENYLSNRQINF